MAAQPLPLAILGTATANLPAVPTAAVAARLGVPEADLVRKTGILARRAAPPEMTFGALGAQAVRAALSAAQRDAASIERLILVNSTGCDDLCPATANHVARELGLGRTLDCFDVNNACSGFLTALDLAARCVATGYDTLAIVAVEMGSRYTDPSEPRSYAIFGDGAAAAIVGRPRGRGAILGSYLRNDPADLEAIRMAIPRASGERPLLRFGGSNEHIMKRSLEVVAESVAEALRRAAVTAERIRWIVPHQPNGPLLDRMLATVGARPSQYVRVVHEHGSLGSASIALGLDAIFRTGEVRPGDLGLLFGVGGGASYGAMVVEFDGEEGRS
jgi:3-oxoacyl-[acyl-carrier-protein] synthase III